MKYFTRFFGLIVVLLVCDDAARALTQVTYSAKHIGYFNKFLSLAELNHSHGEPTAFWVQLTETQIWDESLDLAAPAARFNLTAYHFFFYMIRGFVVSPRSSPIRHALPAALASNDVATLSLQNVDFQLFDAALRPIGSSCRELLAAYHNLTPADFDAAPDKRRLLADFRGLFSFTHSAVLQLTQAVYPLTPMCPLLFKDAAIGLLRINSNVQRSFLKTELFEFSPLDELRVWDPEFELNARVAKFIGLGVYRMPLEYLLRPVFLRHAESVELQGAFAACVEPLLFRSFVRLRRLQVTALNLREFLHSSDNAWLGALDHSGRLEEPLVIGLYGENRAIDVATPDEDFCLFRHFPRSPGVLMALRYSLEGSCLYWFLAEHYLLSNQSTERAKVNRTLIESAVDRCDFPARLKLCSPQKASSLVKRESDKELTMYDLNYVVLFAELLGPVLSFPLVSAVGFLLNTLAVLALRPPLGRRRLFSQNKILAYAQLNAIFNAIECFISALTLVNECLGRHSLFCSAVQSSYGVQLFKVLVVQFVGEAMKTGSILTTLAFSAERYIQTAASEAYLARKFAATPVKRFAVVAIALGFASSLCKLYEYAVEPHAVSFMENPAINIADMIKYSNAFRAAYTIHYVLNDLLLLAAISAFDLLLVVQIRRDLAKKLYFGQLGDSEKREYEKRRTEKRTTKMIVYQLLMYLVCRLPELAFYMHYWIFVLAFPAESTAPLLRYINVCLFFSFCNLMANLIQYLYMLSYVVNVYFLYKFNRTFRNAFKDFLIEKCRLSFVDSYARD